MKTKISNVVKISIVLVLALSLVLSPNLNTAQAQEGIPLPQGLVGRVKSTAARYLAVDRTLLRVSDVQWDDAWAVGYVVVTATETSDPDLLVFIAKKVNDIWKVAIQGQPQYLVLSNELPEYFRFPHIFIDESVLQEDAPDQQDFLQNEGQDFIEEEQADIWVEQPELAFPWTIGYNWKLTGGPHNNEGLNVRPWSSLDFSPGTSGKWEVRSAAAGYVTISSTCKNYVLITHSGGWQTGYYHLNSIAVTNGQYVNRGTFLGKASAESGCGGLATGAHIHFSLRKNGVKQEWKGRYIGGYYVKDGTVQYQGKLVKASNNASVAVGYTVYNDGYVGLGKPATSTATAPSGTVVTSSVPFSWSKAGGATRYALQVAKDSAFTNFAYKATLTSTTVTVPNLANGTYYWRVRGENYSYAGSWSSVKTFVVNVGGVPTPSPIVVNPALSPAYGTTCTTAWYRVTGTGYGGTDIYLTMNTNVSSQSTNGAVWRPTIPMAGRYKVEAYIGHHTAFTWPCTPRNYLASDTSQARYKIFHPAAASGTSVYVDQKPLDNAWALLGEYYFDTGTGGYVQLKDLNGETNLSRTVSFNVVRFTWVGP